MRQGKIEQIGTPEEVYLNPASRFVARFVTQANILPAVRKERVWQTEIGTVEISSNKFDSTDDMGERGDLMLRPEDIVLNPDPNSDIVISERQFLGREYYYCVSTASGKRIYVRTNTERAIAVGTKVALSFDLADPRIFPLAGEAAKPLASAPI